MDCNLFRKSMLDYETRNLKDNERNNCESHLKSCNVCSREWNEWQRTAELLGSLEEIETGADFMPGLYIKLAREDKKVQVKSQAIPWFMIFPKPVMAIAGLLVIIGILFALFHVSGKNTYIADLSNTRSEYSQISYLTNLGTAGGLILPEKLPAYSSEPESDDSSLYNDFSSPKVEIFAEHEDLAQLVLDYNRR